MKKTNILSKYRYKIRILDRINNTTIPTKDDDNLYTSLENAIEEAKCELDSWANVDDYFETRKFVDKKSDLPFAIVHIITSDGEPLDIIALIKTVTEDNK